MPSSSKERIDNCNGLVTLIENSAININDCINIKTVFINNSALTIVCLQKLLVVLNRAVNRNRLTEQLTGYLQIPIYRF